MLKIETLLTKCKILALTPIYSRGAWSEILRA